MVRCKNRKGIALLMAMVILALLSAWVVAVQSFSGSAVQLANNQCKADEARACAESGLEIIRCWISEVSIPGNTDANQKFSKLGKSLQNKANERSSIAISYDTNAIIIPSIILDSASGKSFSAVITPLDSETLRIEVTGNYGSLSKKIRANYKFGKRGSSIFDFGVASKGPVSLGGNVELEGITAAVECYSNMYIESEDELLALSITGSSKIGGDVSIVNPSAYVNLQGGKAEIGGETGQDAIDNHVRIGVPPVDFPTPAPEYFRGLVELTNLPSNYSNKGTFTNVIIPPNTDPRFQSQAVFNGLLVIETPNKVSFEGGVTINGIIVGDGDPNDNSQTNIIDFKGNVSSSSVANLPSGAQFDPLRSETGTFLLAPGFAVKFGGNFHTINGTVAANGFSFSGNAGGIINGSVINYSKINSKYSEDENIKYTMIFESNNNLKFNRSGASTNPPGFVSEIVLKFDPTSYVELPF